MAASVAHQVGHAAQRDLRATCRCSAPASRRAPRPRARLATVQEQIARVTAIVQSLLDQTRRPRARAAPARAGRAALERARRARAARRSSAAASSSRVEVAPGLPARRRGPRPARAGAAATWSRNAVDAMPRRRPAGARRAARPAGDVVLAVADTGTGIPAEDLARVFEPLYTTKPRGKGTGLGLPIVREIVAAHGGTVSAREPAGRAARPRSCALPAAPEEALMARVLVVDDDRETCRFMSELLERARAARSRWPRSPERGARAARGAAASTSCSRTSTSTPSSTGSTCCARSRSSDPDVEVVLISAFGTLETALEAVKAGAFDFVSKPVDIGQVRDVGRARPRPPRPRRRGRAPAASAPDRLGPRRPRRPQRRHARRLQADRPRLRLGRAGARHRRDRHRQGARGPRHPPPRPRARSGRSCPSTAARCPRGCSSRSCSATCAARSPAPWPTRRASSSRRSGGTIFLDEIGEMSPALQVRLLRTLELGEVRPVGSTRVLNVDARVVAATHRDLERAVKDGALPRRTSSTACNVFAIRVPPLRERREDVPLLASALPRRCSRRAARPRASLTPGGDGGARRPRLAGQRPRAREHARAARGRGPRRHDRRRRPAGGACASGARRRWRSRSSPACPPSTRSRSATCATS